MAFVTGAVLVAISLLSAIGNILLSVAVGFSHRDVIPTLACPLLFNLCMATLADSVLKLQTLAALNLLYTWHSVDILGQLAVFVTHITETEVLFGVTLAMIERGLHTCCPVAHRTKITLFRVKITVAFMWMVPCFANIPVLAGTVQVWLQESSFMSCASVVVTNDASMSYSIFSLVVCLTVPCVLLMIATVCTLVPHCFKKHRSGGPQTSPIQASREELIEGARCLDTTVLNRFTVTAFVLYIILKLPFSALTSAQRFLDISGAQQSNLFCSSLLHEVLFWMSISFCFVFPLAIFAAVKPLRITLKEAKYCRRLRTENPTNSAQQHSVETSRLFQVPILYATTDGLHIRKSETAPNVSENTSVTQSPEFLIKPPSGVRCDVSDSCDWTSVSDSAADILSYTETTAVVNRARSSAPNNFVTLSPLKLHSTSENHCFSTTQRPNVVQNGETSINVNDSMSQKLMIDNAVIKSQRTISLNDITCYHSPHDDFDPQVDTIETKPDDEKIINNGEATELVKATVMHVMPLATRDVAVNTQQNTSFYDAVVLDGRRMLHSRKNFGADTKREVHNTDFTYKRSVQQSNTLPALSDRTSLSQTQPLPMTEVVARFRSKSAILGSNNQSTVATGRFESLSSKPESIFQAVKKTKMVQLSERLKPNTTKVKQKRSLKKKLEKNSRAKDFSKKKFIYQNAREVSKISDKIVGNAAVSGFHNKPVRSRRPVKLDSLQNSSTVTAESCDVANQC